METVPVYKKKKEEEEPVTTTEGLTDENEIVNLSEQSDADTVSPDPMAQYEFLKKKQAETSGQEYYDRLQNLEKIKRTNALTDALRLMIDVAGHSKGAKVEKRTLKDYAPYETQLRNAISAQKENQAKINLADAYRKGEQKRLELEAEKKRKQGLEDFDYKQGKQFERQEKLIGLRGDENMAAIQERNNAAMQRAKYNQGQLNARQLKTLEDKEEYRKAHQSVQTNKNYTLNDDDGSVASNLDKGGIDAMVKAIMVEPELAKNYDIIVNKYGDGMAQEAQRRLFVQTYWNKTPQLKNYAFSLNKGMSQQTQAEVSALPNDENALKQIKAKTDLLNKANLTPEKKREGITNILKKNGASQTQINAILATYNL